MKPRLWAFAGCAALCVVFVLLRNAPGDAAQQRPTTGAAGSAGSGSGSGAAPAAPDLQRCSTVLAASLESQRACGAELDALRAQHSARVTALEAKVAALLAAATEAAAQPVPRSPPPTPAPPLPAVTAPVPAVVIPSAPAAPAVGGVGGSSDAVISLCENPARYMTIFLGSLRRTGSRAHVFCFHFQPIDAHVQRVYDAFGPVTAVHFDVAKGHHPVHYRMTAYRDWLQSAAAKAFEKFVLVDSLDMAFQTDPFAEFGADALYLTRETLKTNHTLCKSNRAWVIDCFGQSEYDKMAAAPVLNSGFIGGGQDAIRYVVSAIHAQVSRSTKCADQGVLNWLYHTRQLQRPDTAGVNGGMSEPLPAGVHVEVVSVETGAILHTLESVCAEATAPEGRDVFGRLYNLQRTRVAAVVHQWTRCQGLVSHMFAQYPYTGPWKFPGTF